MQDVNDDMDDLFRQAADQYPLRTDGEDWDKILQGLQSIDVPQPALANGNGKGKKEALWLLLLLPLALLCITLPHNYFNTKNKATLAREKEERRTATNNNNKDIEKTIQSEKQSLTSIPNKENNNTEIDNNNALKIAVTTQKNTEQKQSELKEQVRSINKKEASLQRSNSNKEGNKFIANPNNGSNDKNDITLNKNNTTAKQPDAPSPRIQKEGITGDNNNTIVEQKELNKDTISLHKEDTLNIKKAVAANTKNKRNQAMNQAQHGFYTGLLASFDVSNVKLQKVNKTGYSLNVLAGYRFSKHISVESGINWSSKKYYSNGQYFDKTRTGIPALSEILYTNGSCNMFEIPIAIKYDFAKRTKSNLFATAGLSSYLMKKEDYTYYADHTGNYYTATKTYKNSANNWLSVATVSVGYQLYINKHIALRAEPYLKMPLTGIGIAKLPITSTGISVGFTRSF